MNPNQTFSTTAIFNGNFYQNFGIKASEFEIFDLTIKISEDQTLPPRQSNKVTPDYWGWYDNEAGGLTIIKSKKALLNMEFPYGIAKDEAAGKGKAVRIEIIEVKKATN